MSQPGSPSSTGRLSRLSSGSGRRFGISKKSIFKDMSTQTPQFGKFSLRAFAHANSAKANRTQESRKRSLGPTKMRRFSLQRNPNSEFDGVEDSGSTLMPTGTERGPRSSLRLSAQRKSKKRPSKISNLIPDDNTRVELEETPTVSKRDVGRSPRSSQRLFALRKSDRSRNESDPQQVMNNSSSSEDEVELGETQPVNNSEAERERRSSQRLSTRRKTLSISQNSLSEEDHVESESVHMINNTDEEREPRSSQRLLAQRKTDQSRETETVASPMVDLFVSNEDVEQVTQRLSSTTIVPASQETNVSRSQTSTRTLRMMAVVAQEEEAEKGVPSKKQKLTKSQSSESSQEKIMQSRRSVVEDQGNQEMELENSDDEIEKEITNQKKRLTRKSNQKEKKTSPITQKRHRRKRRINVSLFPCKTKNLKRPGISLARSVTFLKKIKVDIACLNHCKMCRSDKNIELRKLEDKSLFHYNKLKQLRLQIDPNAMDKLEDMIEDMEHQIEALQAEIETNESLRDKARLNVNGEISRIRYICCDFCKKKQKL